MTTNSKKIIASVVIAAAMFTPLLALGLQNLNQQPSGSISDIQSIVTNILNIIWPIFMGLAVIMILVAGFIFLTAGGDPEKVKGARTALIWAVIGIVVAILAYSIPFVVFHAVNG